jgi:hypothetical protein
MELLRKFEIKYCFGRPAIILPEKEARTYLRMVEAIGKHIHQIREIK